MRAKHRGTPNLKILRILLVEFILPQTFCNVICQLTYYEYENNPVIQILCICLFQFAHYLLIIRYSYCVVKYDFLNPN